MFVFKEKKFIRKIDYVSQQLFEKLDRLKAYSDETCGEVDQRDESDDSDRGAVVNGVPGEVEQVQIYVFYVCSDGLVLEV